MNLPEVCKRINQIPIDLIAREMGLDLDGHHRGNCMVGHPSDSGKCFSLNLKNNSAHCFNCGKSWSVIDLYKSKANKSFRESVQILGNRLGLNLKSKSPNLDIPNRSNAANTDLGKWQKKLDTLLADRKVLEFAHREKESFFTRERQILEDLTDKGLFSKKFLSERYNFHDMVFSKMDEIYLAEKNELDKQIINVRQKIRSLIAKEVTD